MATLKQLFDRITDLAVTTGDALQLRGFKSGGTVGQVPVKGAGGDYDWNWGAGSGGGASITVSTTPPVSPTLGAQWYDPEDRIMSVWDGSVWVGTEFLPITITSAVPALAFLALGGEPFTYLGEYFTAPA